MIAAALLLAAAATRTEVLDAMVRAAITCPAPKADEITVCARHVEPGERSRFLSPIPQEYVVGDPRARSVARERYDLLDYDAGKMDGCSTTGPGGQLGCNYRSFKGRVEQRAGARDSRGALYDK